MHRGKVDPGVGELPGGNELSRDHVNRPFLSCGTIVTRLVNSLLLVPSFFKGFDKKGLSPMFKYVHVIFNIVSMITEIFYLI